VVDIETTGSWASGDRITQIDAVKVRNLVVIEEWHSLINPQRSIPFRITQLTGITNDMVRDAPVFAEIADSLMEFMGDGIFVAHNVNSITASLPTNMNVSSEDFAFRSFARSPACAASIRATSRTALAIYVMLRDRSERPPPRSAMLARPCIC
jgi:Exonuclease